jgi:hypothetical protein
METKWGFSFSLKGAGVAVCGALFLSSATAALREENFDREPATWEGVNNRNAYFEAKTVAQDFGYSPRTSHAGGKPGELGGRLNPAGEPAYYGFRLSKALSFDSLMHAEGTLYIAPGSGHFLLGFFNPSTLKEWRARNTMVVRINSRGESSHFHFEYCTDRWRANAGVIGEIVPGEHITPKEIPNGKVRHWKLIYDPSGSGKATFTLDGETATSEISREHRSDGAAFTHFGLLPIPKTWDSAGEMWIDDVIVNGLSFDFSADPAWEKFGNRRAYKSTDTRPKFDFGWSPTHHAQGRRAGELGGLIFRGDCREAQRMGCYGDRLEPLTLKKPIEARGRVSMVRGVTDSTASIGFYHSVESMRANPSQKHSVPMQFLGINIEGPSSEGFFVYPVCRMDQNGAVLPSPISKAPRIYPDGKAHDWSLRYEPAGASGRPRISVTLDEQTLSMELPIELNGEFDRFGICTPWIDGNSVTAYFDDLTYTFSQ